MIGAALFVLLCYGLIFGVMYWPFLLKDRGNRRQHVFAFYGLPGICALAVTVLVLAKCG